MQNQSITDSFKGKTLCSLFLSVQMMSACDMPLRKEKPRLLLLLASKRRDFFIRIFIFAGFIRFPCFFSLALLYWLQANIRFLLLIASRRNIL